MFPDARHALSAPSPLQLIQLWAYPNIIIRVAIEPWKMEIEYIILPKQNYQQEQQKMKSKGMNISLAKVLMMLCTLTIGTVVAVEGPCPTGQHGGSIYSTQIIAAYGGGIVPLDRGKQTECYTHNFPFDFTGEVEVAISVHDFEIDPSEAIEFYIKPLYTNVTTMIQILIHTHWSKTEWLAISFSLLVENRKDISSGYYLVDSGPLAGCQLSKEVQVILPFREYFVPGSQIKHKVFLHGFEIETISKSGHRSPFQLQISHSYTNTSGVIVTLSVTTETQVNEIYISFLAYSAQTKLQIHEGIFNYENINNNEARYVPPAYIPRNYARIYGVTGFIMNYNGKEIIYKTKWNGQQFSFQFNNIEVIKFLIHSYIFFSGSICKDCPGYPITHNDTCVNYCPIGTFRTEDDICLSCGPDKEWNGVTCVQSCPKGQFLNAQTQVCECPPSLNWNGDSCIPCVSGRTFDQLTKTCECPRPLRWNGFACAQTPECTGGKIWDVYTYSCQCPEGTFQSNKQCQQIPFCSGGQILDMNYRCSCPNRYYWNGTLCIYDNCIGGQFWNGKQCACPLGKHFNGSMCVECINGQIWMAEKNGCECESGYKWNGQYCEKSRQCSGNRVWSEMYEQCICSNDYYWSGYACLPKPNCTGGRVHSISLNKCVCPSYHNWNGTLCIRCENGNVWDQKTLACLCPPGTVKINQTCTIIQSCSGGKMWMQEIMSCECPANTEWNGNFCIANPCTGGRYWNQTLKSCSCGGIKIWDGQSCIPPKIACTNGRVWNPSIYACECPPLTYPSYNSCLAVPVCGNGKTYNPLNNKCHCPPYLKEDNNACVNMKCPDDQYWNGYTCEIIKCSPPRFFKNGQCVFGEDPSCLSGYYWNGYECRVMGNHCPQGTFWSNLTCKSVGACKEGYYVSSTGNCILFPQKCAPKINWNGHQCVVKGHQCPKGTYFSKDSCQPVVPCKNNYVWNKNLLRCECPPNTIESGDRCVECNGGKKWFYGKGCCCPEGSFDVGSKCEEVQPERCSNIPNSIWQGHKCVCRQGFTQQGFQCICVGVQIGKICNRCSFKPHSSWKENSCKCDTGYSEVNKKCVPSGTNPGNDQPSLCNVGTYFDSSQKMCLPCPIGCLSCDDCYTCKYCRPEFFYSYQLASCVEHCGDGKKFTLECDDGNNEDGDGCSRDCKVEMGFTCKGGSPDTADNCALHRPAAVTLKQTGQVRLSTSIVLNIRADFLPKALLQSSSCANQCVQLLDVKILSGDRSSTSITSKYISGTSFSFVITVEFGKTYIGEFQAEIKINPTFSSFFGSTMLGPGLKVKVHPSYLAAINEEAYIS